MSPGGPGAGPATAASARSAGPGHVRGLSLTEVLISIFLLSAAFLLVTNLFHAGLRHQRRADEQATATRLAQNKLEEVVAWAAGRTGTAYHYDDWSPYAGVEGVFADAPGYHFRVDVTDARRSNPCSAFEPALQPASLKGASAQLVRVRVWSSGPPVELSTLVGEPVRELLPAAPIRITPTSAVPDPLAKGDSVTFQARAYDDNDQAISDVTFQWYLAPGTGNGTLTQTPDGSQATFTNVLNLPLRPPSYTGGSCVLRVRMRYGGLDVTRDTPPINLEGP